MVTVDRESLPGLPTTHTSDTPPPHVFNVLTLLIQAHTIAYCGTALTSCFPSLSSTACSSRFRPPCRPAPSNLPSTPNFDFTPPHLRNYPFFLWVLASFPHTAWLGVGSSLSDHTLASSSESDLTASDCQRLPATASVRSCQSPASLSSQVKVKSSQVKSSQKSKARSVRPLWGWLDASFSRCT